MIMHIYISLAVGIVTVTRRTLGRGEKGGWRRGGWGRGDRTKLEEGGKGDRLIESRWMVHSQSKNPLGFCLQ